MVKDQWVLLFCTSGNHDVRFKFFSLKSLARGSMCGHGAAGREGERLRGNILRAFTAYYLILTIGPLLCVYINKSK